MYLLYGVVIKTGNKQREKRNRIKYCEYKPAGVVVKAYINSFSKEDLTVALLFSFIILCFHLSFPSPPLLCPLHYAICHIITIPALTCPLKNKLLSQHSPLLCLVSECSITLYHSQETAKSDYVSRRVICLYQLSQNMFPILLCIFIRKHSYA